MNNEPILEFSGENHFLSNFERAEFVWDGIVWPTSEHAYQAAKVIDREGRIAISKVGRPGEAKKLGKTFNLRPDWSLLKIDIMYAIVYEKFRQNPHLKAKLLATGDAYLEEGNNWGDVVWGVCNGVGQNNLGLILMRVRDELESTA
jgi:hypothetical protein